MAKSSELVSITQLGDRRVPCTTSRRIAEVYKKDHYFILKKIKKMIKNGEITEGTYDVSEYTDPTGRTLPMYTLDNEATMALVISFTTKEDQKHTQKFFREFIRLVKKRAKDSRIIRTQFDEPADLNRLLTDMLIEARKNRTDGKSPETTDVHFLSLAKWVNEHVFGDVEPKSKPRDNMTLEQYQNLVKHITVAVRGVLKGIIHKKELFSYFQANGLNPAPRETDAGRLEDRNKVEVFVSIEVCT
jgi:Rha family phage regulatory protein